MKILFLMDSRATYSYSRNVLIHFKRNKNIKTLVTGNYLDPRFGINLTQFKKDKIKIDEKIKFQSAPTNAPEKLAKYQIPKLLYNFSAIAMLANAPIEHIK